MVGRVIITFVNFYFMHVFAFSDALGTAWGGGGGGGGATLSPEAYLKLAEGLSSFHSAFSP